MAKLYLKYVDNGIPLLFHVILCILAYLFWTLSLIILLPPVFFFRVYKIVEKALISYQQLGAVISKFDLPFIHETENNRNFIVGMMELKGDANIKKLRKHLLSRLFDKNRELDETYKRLSQKISRRYFSYVWTDEENFSINQHIPIYKGALPKTKEDIEKLFIEFIIEPCARNISPWKMRIIPKHDNSGFLLFCKIHHTIGDGFAMVGLLSNLVDKKPEFIRLSNRKVGFMTSSIKRVVSGVLTGPLAVLALVLSLKFKNPFHSKESPMKKVISSSNPIPMECVKEIKSKTDTTVNDVLMSCLAGAIRNYLCEVGKSDELADLPIAMTFNSRSRSDKLKNVIPLGNNSGGVLFDLPISVADPFTRLAVTRNKINKLKGLSHPQIFSAIYNHIIGILPDIIARLSTFAIKRHIALIVSNIPGPVESIYMMGFPVERIVFVPPLVADTGLSVSMFSYNGVLKMTIMSDENIIKNPSALTENFEKEVRLLADRIKNENFVTKI